MFRLIRFISKCGAIVCSVIITIMVVITMVDTVCRYLLNSPIHGAIELNEVMFPAFVFLGLAYTQLDKGHIRVTFLLDHLGSSGRRSLELLAWLSSAFVAGTFGYRTWIAAMYSYAIQEEYWSVIKGMTLYVWPAKMAVSIGLWMLVLQCLADAIETFHTPNPGHGADKEISHV